MTWKLKGKIDNNLLINGERNVEYWNRKMCWRTDGKTTQGKPKLKISNKYYLYRNLILILLKTV